MKSESASGIELPAESFGLTKHRLSGIETLAQSFSSVAPTAGPTVLIPLVFAAAGNGTWLSYLLATLAVYLVALNVAGFAADSSSPGSLFAYATSVFKGPAGQLCAWSLLLAYLATASAVAGGLTSYVNVLLHALFGITVPPLLLALASLGLATLVAYRDVKISARLMLWLEALSLGSITLVILVTLHKTGFHLDTHQWRLEHVSPSGIRLGLVLAIFSFVGFESATALGEEAQEPRRTIPRAVILSALFAGLFFMFCAYAEVLGFREAGQDLGQTTSPMHVLADRVGLSMFGPVIDVGAAMSFLACAIACITAAARILLFMAHRQLLSKKLGQVHAKNKTPAMAVLVAGAASMLGPTFIFQRGATGFDVNGWMGSLATLGFLIAYLFVCIALPVYLQRKRRLTIKLIIAFGLAVLVLVGALIGSVYPAPPPPASYLNGLFVLYLLAGFGWSLRANRDQCG
jgi:amino acid transporter